MDPATEVHSALQAGTIYSSSTLGLENALGWIDNGPVGPDANNVVVAYTLLGDANCDGTVNGTDLDLLAENWGTDATTWAQGDFFDCAALHGQDPGSIGALDAGGSSDLTYLKSNFGSTVAPPPPQVLRD